MPIRRALQDVRAAAVLAPARPAYAAGLRAALATVAPLAAAQLLGISGGTWMSLAGFSGALADKGGPYRARAATLTAVSVTASLAVLIGTFTAASASLAVPVTLLVAIGCGLARAYGNAGTSVGGSALTAYVIALAYPPTHPSDAAARAGFMLLGGGWAMLVSLVLWPLRPYRPVRLALSSAYDALAEYADHVAGALREARAPAGAGSVRAALEAASATLATVRRGRPGETGRGERLLVLRELADQIFGHLIGLSDTIEAIPRERQPSEAGRVLAEIVEQLAGTARAVAAGIERETSAELPAVSWSGEPMRHLATVVGSDDSADEGTAHLRQAAALVDRMAQFAEVATAMTAALNTGRPLPPLERAREVEDSEPPMPAWVPLRAALSPRSVVLRYAVRLALVAAAAVWLTGLWRLNHGYWVTITSIIILQPYAGLTRQRAMQRVLGTVVGGILTAGLAALFHDPLAILTLAFVFSGLSVALLPLNYAAFSVFLTPTFVLLAEASAGDWHLAGVRITNTLLGGGLALLGSRLLWPTAERERLPATLADMFRALRRYLARVVELFGDRSESASRTLRAARRDVGLAILNAEESFQRLLAEHHGPAEALDPVMTMLTYARRFTASTAALALSRHALHEPPPPTLAQFAGTAEASLGELADALEETRRPAPLTPKPDRVAAEHTSPLLLGRLSRLDRQLISLHDAVERWGRWKS